MANIPDSGLRTEFPSGAVRDISEGKGRCDLLPFGVIYKLTGWAEFQAFQAFVDSGIVNCLASAFESLADEVSKCDTHEARIADFLLGISRRFEFGAEHYGENNWRKGIPCKRYIDSAVRHDLEWRRGDTNEEHVYAAGWNLICCIETAEKMPELNEYAKGVQK